MDTDVFLGSEALPKIVNGVNKAATAVGATMGPRGRNAIIRKRGRTYVTRDGVTVAEAINLPDKNEQAGVELLQNAAREVDGLNGDGTTTVTVLTQAILQHAQPLIADGANPMLLKNSLEQAAVQVVEYIKSQCRKITKLEELEEIATVAASDPEIGKIVAGVVWELGVNSLVTLKEGQSAQTDVETVTGIQLDTGLASPYLVRDPASQSTAFDEPYVVICDRPLRDKEDVAPILKLIHSMEDAKAIILAHDIVGDALNIITLNSVKGVINAVAVPISPHIDDKTSYLQDIAAVTGGTVIGKDNGSPLEAITEEHLGRVSSVVAGMEKTVMVRGYGAEEDVEARKQAVLELKKDTKKFQPDVDKRLAVLEGKVAIITIGGNSQSEIEERHYRFEDAVGASKTAMRGGTIPGAGSTLFGASDELGTTDGELVLAQALKQPAIQILTNAGFYNEEVFMKLAYNAGLDVATGYHTTDLAGQGIVDPAESAISSVNVAVSTAGLLMTAGSLITDVEKKYDKTEL
jgi:chaperonin GroEL